MRFDEEGLEETAIGFDLPLQFFIGLRTHARLLFIRHDVVDIGSGSVGAQDRAIKPALLLPEVVDQTKWYEGEHRYIDPERRYIFAFNQPWLPLYGTPLVLQPPRYVRIGVTYDY